MNTREYFIDSLAKRNVTEEVDALKCVHDPNSHSGTLQKVSKRFMIHPEVQDYFCKVCHKTFRYTKHGDIYTLVKSD